MKLHLGCGNIRLEGFCNIDIRYLPAVDRVDNIRYLRSFEDNSIDEIYVSHVLEHLGRWDYMTALYRWHELLQKGGVLKVCVPDWYAIVLQYVKTGDLEELHGLLYGGQDYEENKHYCCWDFNLLKQKLEKVGFTNVEKYDWRTTIHANVDDCSQAYLPKMDKENGLLMSLNVQAVK